MLDAIVSAILSVAITADVSSAKPYPNSVLVGAAEIVNRAIASNGKTSANELKEQIDAYMQKNSVVFPAKFKQGENDEVVIHAVLVKTRAGGKQDLVALYSDTPDHKLKSMVLYTGNIGKEI